MQVSICQYMTGGFYGERATMSLVGEREFSMVGYVRKHEREIQTQMFRVTNAKLCQLS